MLNLFFTNRRLLVLTIALIVVTGLSSTYVMPRLEDPVLKQRASLIHTPFPGANAARVEALVSEEIEQALKEIEEMRLIRSISRNELSTITMELHDHVTDVENVWSRVRDKLNDVQASLPPGAMTPHFVDLKFSAYAALFALKWTGEGPPNAAIMNRYAERLEQRIRHISGTDDVDLFGAATEEILIELDQRRISAMGLTPNQIATAVLASDAKVSAGGLRGDKTNMVVEVNSEFESLKRIAETPIQVSADGAVVTLGDVAEVSKTVTDPPESVVLIDGVPAITIGSFVQPQVRIDLWTYDAREVLKAFQAELPAGLAVDTVFEQEQYVTQRLSTLLINLALGATAVVAVIFFMMGWRSAVVIGMALPLSGLMVLGGLRMLQIPLHQMSVTGLIIALGLLIDNAIVVVDETRNRIREGLSAAAAIIASVKHLAIPLAGSTFTTCLAFAPLALMPGPAGEFVGSIGISVILAVASSLFLSMTVIPALFGIIDRASESSTERRFWNDGAGTEWLFAGYRRSLQFLFQRPYWGLLAGVVLPAVGFYYATTLPEQFFPPSDRDQFQIAMQLSSQASIQETEKAAKRVRELAMEFDDIERVDWYIGESAPAFYYNMLPVRAGMPNYGQAMVQLKTGEHAKDTIHRLQARLETEMPGIHLMVRQLEQGPPVDAPIMIRVYGPDLEKIRELGQQVRLVASQVNDVVATTSDVANTTPKLSLAVDERKAKQSGLSHFNIARQLSSALDGDLGGSLMEGTEVLPVRIRLRDEYRKTSDQLGSLELINQQPSGMSVQIPVEAIADWNWVPNDASIERINGFRVNEVQVHVKAGVLASQVLNDIRDRMEQANLSVPVGYSIDFAGESAERNRAVGNLLASAGVLVVLMVAGLVLSFQSFRLAGLIGVIGILSIGVGLAALWWFGYPFGFMAIVGIMGLVGVAINDSIVVLAGILDSPAAKSGDRRAIEAVVFRATRHVLSTTLTTIGGFTPLILAGGGFWPPLAITIAGGVSGATILALYFVPSAYLMLYGERPARVPKQRVRLLGDAAAAESEAQKQKVARGERLSAANSS